MSKLCALTVSKLCALCVSKLLPRQGKLTFLRPSKEHLPYPLWDPDQWTYPCQLDARPHNLGYLATDPQQRLQLVKFTQQHGV